MSTGKEVMEGKVAGKAMVGAEMEMDREMGNGNERVSLLDQYLEGMSGYTTPDDHERSILMPRISKNVTESTLLPTPSLQSTIVPILPLLQAHSPLPHSSPSSETSSLIAASEIYPPSIPHPLNTSNNVSTPFDPQNENSIKKAGDDGGLRTSLAIARNGMKIRQSNPVLSSGSSTGSLASREGEEPKKEGLLGRGGMGSLSDSNLGVGGSNIHQPPFPFPFASSSTFPFPSHLSHPSGSSSPPTKTPYPQQQQGIPFPPHPLPFPLPLPSPGFQDQFKYLLCSSGMMDVEGVGKVVNRRKKGEGKDMRRGEGEREGMRAGEGGSRGVGLDVTDTDVDMDMDVHRGQGVPGGIGMGLAGMNRSAGSRSRSGKRGSMERSTLSTTNDDNNQLTSDGTITSIGLGLGLSPLPNSIDRSNLPTTVHPRPLSHAITRIPSSTSTSTASSAYMTAAGSVSASPRSILTTLSASGSGSGSGSASSTPVMRGGGVWMLPLVDFEVPLESEETDGGVGERLIVTANASEEMPDGLRRRRRGGEMRNSVARTASPLDTHSASRSDRSKSRSSSTSTAASTPTTFTTLLFSIIYFLLRSFGTILGLLVVWGWIQVKIAWELGRWGWGLVGCWSVFGADAIEGEEGAVGVAAGMNGHAIGNGHGNGHAVLAQEPGDEAAVEQAAESNSGTESGTAQDVSAGKAWQEAALDAMKAAIEESERFDEVVGDSFELLEQQER